MKYTTFVELINHYDLSFVAKAISKDDDLPQFWYMKIQENETGLLATATDGKRLHRVQIDKDHIPKGLEPGYWRVLKNKKNKYRDIEAEYDAKEEGIIGRGHLIYKKEKVLWIAKLADGFGLFPSDKTIERIFPSGEPEMTGELNLTENAHTAIIGFIKALPPHVGFNFYHALDLAPDEWNFKYYVLNKAVLFENGNKTALIMPSDYRPRDFGRIKRFLDNNSERGS
jgi:hypothetical protein